MGLQNHLRATDATPADGESGYTEAARTSSASKDEAARIGE